MRRPLAMIAAGAAVLLGASCGGGSPEPAASAPATTSAASAEAPGTDAATTTAIPAGATPELSISSPADGSTVPGDSITVELDVENFNVVNKIGAKDRPTEGHVHFYLDVEDIPTEAGEEAVVTGDEGRYVATSSTSYTWKGLVPGDHIVGAQLVKNDHTPLEPPVGAQIRVTVGA